MQISRFGISRYAEDGSAIFVVEPVDIGGVTHKVTSLLYHSMRMCLPGRSLIIALVGKLAEVGKKPAWGVDDGDGKFLPFSYRRTSLGLLLLTFLNR